MQDVEEVPPIVATAFLSDRYYLKSNIYLIAWKENARPNSQVQYQTYSLEEPKPMLSNHNLVRVLTLETVLSSQGFCHARRLNSLKLCS